MTNNIDKLLNRIPSALLELIEDFGDHREEMQGRMAFEDWLRRAPQLTPGSNPNMTREEQIEEAAGLL